MKRKQSKDTAQCIELVFTHGVGHDVPEAYKSERARDRHFMEDVAIVDRYFPAKDEILLELDNIEVV